MFPRYACRPLRSVSVSTPSNPFSLSLSAPPRTEAALVARRPFFESYHIALPSRPLSSSFPSWARRLAFHEQVVCFNGSSTLRLAFLCTSLKGRRIAARCHGNAICAGGIEKASLFLFFFYFTPLPHSPLPRPSSSLSFFFARLSSSSRPPPHHPPAPGPRPPRAPS